VRARREIPFFRLPFPPPRPAPSLAQDQRGAFQGVGKLRRKSYVECVTTAAVIAPVISGLLTAGFGRFGPAFQALLNTKCFGFMHAYSFSLIQAFIPPSPVKIFGLSSVFLSIPIRPDSAHLFTNKIQAPSDSSLECIRPEPRGTEFQIDSVCIPLDGDFHNVFTFMIETSFMSSEFKSFPRSSVFESRRC